MVLYCVQLMCEEILILFVSFFLAILILKNVFVVVVLYCVQLLSEVFFILFVSGFFSWAILILNNMFVVVVLYCVQLLSEDVVSIVSVFFHEQPWSSIVCLLWWSSIVSSFFWMHFFPKSLSPFLFLSVAIAFVSCLVQFSWHTLLGFYGVSLGFWQHFHENSM